jgi:hypothetical protein
VRPLAALPSRHVPLPTGFPVLDTLLNGGLPGGAITALAGGPSSGALTLALQVLAHAQRAGLLAAWVDGTGLFDAVAAWRAGLRLDDLLLVQPESFPAALGLAHDLINEGSCGLLLLDAGDAALPEPALRLLSHAVTRSPAVLIVKTAPRVLVPNADLRLNVTRTGWEMAGGDCDALRARVVIETGRRAGEGRSTELVLPVDEAAPCWPVS